MGCRMVVSCGVDCDASGTSSKPTTARSPGTSIPSSAATSITVSAERSFAANTAVGRPGWARSLSAASRTVSGS